MVHRANTLGQRGKKGGKGNVGIRKFAVGESGPNTAGCPKTITNGEKINHLHMVQNILFIVPRR